MVAANGYGTKVVVVDKDARRMTAMVKPDGSPPDMERPADILVYEVNTDCTSNTRDPEVGRRERGRQVVVPGRVHIVWRRLQNKFSGDIWAPRVTQDRQPLPIFCQFSDVMRHSCD